MKRLPIEKCAEDIARKSLVASGNRREGVYKRAGELGESFCGKGGTVERRLIFYEIKNRSQRNLFRRRRRFFNGPRNTCGPFVHGEKIGLNKEGRCSRQRRR